MGKTQEARLHQLGLPPDIVDIARNHRDIPPKAQDRILALIQEYTSEIASLQHLIVTLELPKQWYTRKEFQQSIPKIQVRIDACRGLLSIMRTIPLEIMGEIFQYYLSPGGFSTTSETKNGSGEGSDGSREGPAIAASASVLCLVCRYWKTVATTIPALWSDITIKASQQTEGGVPLVKAAHVRGIWSWMERVSSYPWQLKIRLSWDKMYRTLGDDDSSGVPLLQLLNRPASLHVERLTISGITESVGTIGINEITFPRATSVIIDYSAWDRKHPGLPGFPSLPHVTQANLNNVFTVINDFDPDTLIPPVIPWSQLTHLYLGGELELRRWRAAFKHCVALQQGCFTISYCEDKAYTEPTAAILPDLTELVFLHLSPFEEPLQGLSLPSLTKLRIFTNWNEPTMEFSNPQLFDSLTHLTLISSTWVQAHFFLDILKNLPQLVELFFRPWGVANLKAAFEYLTYGHDGNFKSRQLKALGMLVETDSPEIDDDGGPVVAPDFPYDAFASLVASRTRAIKNREFSSVLYTLAPLEHLVLRLDVQSDNELAGRLREIVAPFKAHGLKASVFPAWDRLDPRGAQLGGAAPNPPYNVKHWDEGFMEDIYVEEYSLYPTEDSH